MMKKEQLIIGFVCALGGILVLVKKLPPLLENQGISTRGIVLIILGTLSLGIGIYLIIKGRKKNN